MMPPILKGKDLRLRPASIDDVEVRFFLGNHAKIVEMFGVTPSDVHPMTREDAAGWVQGLIDNPHAWVIEVDEKLAGEIRLDNVDLRDRRASMAIGIYDPKLIGRGLGSEAIRLVLQHAFSDLRLHRIGIRVLAYNRRAMRAYQKCGFVIEGREREVAFVNGVWHDDVMMGLLDHEFLPRSS